MGCAPSLQAGYILTTTYYSVTFKTAIFSFTHSLLNCCIFAPQVVLCDSSIASMEFKEYQKVGLMKKVMIIFLLTFLVFGHKNTTVIAMNKNKMVMLSQTQQKPQQQQQQQEEEERQEQSLKHSVEVFFSSKRRVPNASDPLHNR